MQYPKFDVTMPSTMAEEELIKEWILNNPVIMDKIAEMVNIDMKARFPMELPKETYEECVCVSQCQMVAGLLMNVTRWFTG